MLGCEADRRKESREGGAEQNGKRWQLQQDRQQSLNLKGPFSSVAWTNVGSGSRVVPIARVLEPGAKKRSVGSGVPQGVVCHCECDTRSFRLTMFLCGKSPLPLTMHRQSAPPSPLSTSTLHPA